MKNRRNYVDGYLPKIAYHLSESNLEQVEHFTKRHETTYGKLTSEDMRKVFDMVYEHIE